MVAEIEFVTDITIIVVVASLITVLFHQIKQPTILGYLVAGMAFGSSISPFVLVKNVDAIRLLAELGVILLLFFLGLEFSVKKLRNVSLVAMVTGGIEMPLMIAIGYYLGILFGWSPMDSIFLGAIICVSSTAILVKVLEDMKCMQELSSQIIFGILVVEDFGIIIIIAILSGIGTMGTVSYLEVGGIILKLAIFVGAFLTLGHALIPRLIDYIAKFHVAEVLVLAVLGLCFGAALSTFWLGFSTAAGAFLVGAVLAESRHAGEIARLTQPIRNMFAALFFISIGMLFDFSVFMPLLIPALIITLVNIAGKIFTCSLGTLLSGYDGKTALRVGMGKSNVGEFSFVVAKIGKDSGVASGFLYPISIFVAVVTTLFTPYFIKKSPQIASSISKFAPKGLKTYLSNYTVWMYNLRQAAGGRGSASIALRRTIRRIFADISVIALIVILLQIAYTHVSGQFAFYEAYLDIILAGVATALVAPFVMMMLRNLGRLTDLAGELLKSKASPYNQSGDRYTHRIAQNLIRVLVIVIIIVFSIVVTPLLIAPLFSRLTKSIIIFLAIASLVALYLSREYLSGVYDKVEALYHKILSKEENESTHAEEEESI
ncbi:MAG: cation:proton antiporter [Candidatus Bathyarchaeia archaeon]